MDYFINGNLASDLHGCYLPRNGYEKLMVQQLVAAAVELDVLIAEAPDQPDARWIRQYTLSDRVFQRNHRLLEKAGVYIQPTEVPQAAPSLSSGSIASADSTHKAVESRPTSVAASSASDPNTPSEWVGQLLKHAEAFTPEMRDQLAEAQEPLALIAEWAGQGLDPEAAAFWLHGRHARAAA